VRKIKSNFFISLDGVVESPDQWHFPYFNDEMGDAVGAGFATTDAILMGRVLYDEWAAYWPEHADEPFGDVLNSIKKYVVSNSLHAAEWQNSEIISGDVAQKLTDLKAQDGGDITMSPQTGQRQNRTCGSGAGSCSGIGRTQDEFASRMS
jgi:dihydrofolate reductase